MSVMFEAGEKNLDWLKDDEKEEIKHHPLFDQSTTLIQDETESHEVNSHNTLDQTYHSNNNHLADDDNIPSWLKDELLPPTTPNSKKPRSTIKYKKPQKTSQRHKSSSSQNPWSMCSCCCPEDPILYWFRVFHSLCGFMGVLSFISNLFILFDVPLDLRNIIIHIYALLLCTLIVATELEVPFVLSKLSVLESWIFRGLFYFFVGVISVTTGRATVIVIYQDVVCLLLMVLGCTYCLMGLVCLQSVESNRVAIQSSYYTELVDDFSSPTKV